MFCWFANLSCAILAKLIADCAFSDAFRAVALAFPDTNLPIVEANPPTIPDTTATGKLPVNRPPETPVEAVISPKSLTVLPQWLSAFPAALI